MSETKPNPPTDPRDGFTPGPWITGEPPHEDCIYGTDDWIVAKACPEQPHMRANARLIAAAPTLLADNERQARVIEEVVAVLSSLEWIPAERTDCNVFYRCPCCGVRKDVEGHAYGCPLHSALALAGGGESKS